MSGSLQRTESAVARLGAAIERLEIAAARVGAGDLLLAGELRDARDSHSDLRDTTQMVGQKLDATMARLRALLEE